MFRRGNPFVCAREETSSTHRASHLRAGLSLSWPSHVHIQPNLLKSCQELRNEFGVGLPSGAESTGSYEEMVDMAVYAAFEAVSNERYVRQERNTVHQQVFLFSRKTSLKTMPRMALLPGSLKKSS